LSFKSYKNVAWLPVDSVLDIVLQKDIPLPVVESKFPVTAVFAFAFSKDKKHIYLMKNRNKERGLDIPGGHVEKHESSMDALNREVLEEIGCILSKTRYVGAQIIRKKRIEDNDKYPFLESAQLFFMAEVDTIVTDKLEEDSLERIKIPVIDFFKSLNNRSDIYYIELFNQAFLSLTEAQRDCTIE